jgi:2-dehydropantoate 2-reductase
VARNHALGAAQEADILSTIWYKLLVSACVNPTNALTHGVVDALVASPRMHATLLALALEVMAVGTAVGAKHPKSAAAWLEWCREGFQPHCKFSMLQDVEAGREAEVQALVVAVADVAAAVGVATPRLDAVAALMEHYNANIMASGHERGAPP